MTCQLFFFKTAKTCGYSKESSQCDGSFEYQKQVFKPKGKFCLFVCLVLNDASTLVGHQRQTVLTKHDEDGKS